MGASGWHYFVPYEDPAAALDRLRGDVWRRRAFAVTRRWLRQPKTLEEAVEWAAQRGTHSILDMQRVLDTPFPPQPSIRDLGALPSDRLAASIREATAWHGCVAPLSDERLEELFETSTPSTSLARDRVSTISAKIGELCPRWAGVFFTTYGSDRAPADLCFVGWSGD